MKRVVLSGYFGFKNFGDEAILAVLVNKLKELRASITVISSEPQYTKSLYKHIRSVYTFDIKNIIGFIAKSDILISGGGSLLQDVTSLKSLIYYLFIIFIGVIFRKKVIVFAQGIGPINNPFGRFLTKNILKHCSYISVRDIKSQQLLLKWGIKSDLLCDPIFSTKFEPLEKTDTLVVQLRDFKTMTNDFIERLALKVNQLYSQMNIEILSFQDDIDLNICNEFEKNLKMLNSQIKSKVFSNLTNDEIIEKISTSKYIIAMRFHAIIIGILSYTKVLAIDYDYKVQRIAEEFSLPMIDLEHEFLDEFEVLENIDTNTYNAILCDKQFDWSNIEKFF